MPLGSSFVSSLNRFGFGHVFAFFRGPVETRAFLMVNMRLGVNPNQTVASARRGRFRRCLSARAFRWGWGRSSRTGGSRRTFWFEQIADVEFTW
jgi:hypothetical protein